MNDSAAKNLVKTTFESPYSRDRFLTFTKNLFKSFDESKAFHARGYVKDKFKKTAGVIKTYERLSTYTDPDGNRLDVLTVFLEKDNSLDRARTTQRNFIADYLKQRDAKEAALVAFVPPKVEEWRLSLVKMDYHIGKTKSGKIKAIAELTPARRFSYLVGRGESTHTAQKQLLPILLNDNQSPNLADLEKAFSVEVVTKDFFEKYKTLFLNTKEALDKIVAKDAKIKSDFTEKNIDTVDFTKKLLGQIVFLYFLQRKGWFGVKREQKWGSGPKAFLRELFKKKHGNYRNFFNDILEPLFYNTLAVERPYDYSDKFDCRIPFLNGGLFDPLGNYDWYKTDILLPDRLFSNKEKTKEGDIGTGVLDVFDRYNFTVKEDEPLDKEVAVDPEMLGKVFENLLEVKDRKSKGTYYTPREIVHYMCQQSLINYLSTELYRKAKKKDLETLIRFGETAIEHDAHIGENGKETSTYSYKLPESVRKNAQLIDEKLASIRVCDPAIGSGAFPVGMMSLIVKTRNVLTSYFKDKTGRSAYDFKRHAIANSLYGVDIDLGAVEIAKLRLWLSLIVDEQDIKKIKPLPNLDYKIMQGNSLVELLSPDLVRKGVDQEKNKLIDQLNEFKNQYFEATSRKEKIKLRNRINELIVFIANYDKAKELEQSKNLLANLKAQKSLFSLGPENLTLGEVESKEVKKLKKKVKELEKIKDTSPEDHFEWHLNFNEVFEEKEGFDIEIANPPYVRADSKDPSYLGFRKILLNLGQYKTLYEKWDLFIPFIEKSLYLLNEKGRLSFIVSNAICTSKYAFKLLDLIQNNYYPFSIDYFENIQVFEAGVIPVVLHIGKDLSREPVKKIIRSGSFNNITSQEEYNHEDFKKLGRLGFKKDFRTLNIKIPTINLRDICYMSVGMVINADEKTAKGEFTKDDLISEAKTNIHTKRYIEGKDINRYKIKRSRYLEWNTSRVPKKLRRPTFPELYNRPKIMRGRVTEGIYNESGLVCNDSIILFVRYADLKGVENRSIRNSIKKFNTFPRTDLENNSNNFDLRYLLAIINSRFANVYLNNIRRHRLKNYFYPDDFRNLPIADIPLSGQKSLANLVEKISILKKSNSDKDREQAKEHEREIEKLDKKIDKEVYKLYELTPEEIEIVEKN